MAFAEGGTLPRQSGARRASANSNNENKRNRDFNKRGAASLANPPFWYSFGASKLFAYPLGLPPRRCFSLTMFVPTMVAHW